jgi:SpoIIAA-like
MIEYNFDEKDAILTVRPRSSLEKEDFQQLAKAVDPYVAAKGDLRGVLIDAPKFPGWKSFGDLVGHVQFVRDHHKHVKKIAIVTDSPVGTFAERLGAHFISAEIKEFSSTQLDAAKQWIFGGSR